MNDSLNRTVQINIVNIGEIISGLNRHRQQTIGTANIEPSDKMNSHLS